MVGLIRRIYNAYKKRKLVSEIGEVGNNFVWKGKYVEYPQRFKVGDNVYIGPGARIYAQGKVEIESGVIVGPNLTIFTYNHNYFNAKYLPYDERFVLKKVVIGRNTWIGDSVSIVPGVTIGEGCIIGMRSVLTKDIPPFSLVGGNPARVLKKREDIDNYHQLVVNGNSNYLKNKIDFDLKPEYVVEKKKE